MPWNSIVKENKLHEWYLKDDRLKGEIWCILDKTKQKT